MNPIHFNFIYPVVISPTEKDLCTRILQFIYGSRKVLLEKPDICITLLMFPDIKVLVGISKTLYLDFNQYRVCIRRYNLKGSYEVQLAEMISKSEFYNYFMAMSF